MISLYNKKGNYSSLRDWADILLTIGVYMGLYLFLIVLIHLPSYL